MATIYCRQCGAKFSDRTKACPVCGCANEGTLTASVNKVTNGKSMAVYLILAWFLGFIGIHKFYAGKTGQGIAMLLMGTIGWALFLIPGVAACIWALIDFIIGLCNISTPEKIFRKK